MPRVSRFIGLFLTAGLLAVVHGWAGEASLMPDLSRIADGKVWKLSDVTAEPLGVDGKKAAHLQSMVDSANGAVGMALANGTKFSTGTIDIDLQGKSDQHRCFLGVVFNVADSKTFECVYFRPFNFRTNEPYRLRAVQYIAWPSNTWEHLRKNTPGEFEKPINPAPDPDGWFHVHIEVNVEQVRVFVNHNREACLTVRRLAEARENRPVGLFVDTHDGLYANLEIRPYKPNAP
jgi:hypothetical protein